MNTNQLKNELKKENISEYQYSLNGKLKCDALILRKQRLYWEVFYFDEKGNEQNNKIFKTEKDACEFIYKTLVEDKNIQIKYGGVHL